MAVEELVLAVTGASGSPYAQRLLRVLATSGRTVHLTISPAAVQVLEREAGVSINLKAFDPAAFLGPEAADRYQDRIHYHHFMDFGAGIASGSFPTAGMVICPCSMGTIGAIAHGLSTNLIHRAADVHLKERRKLIVVPRETPLNVIQLRNLTALAEAGAVVLPAMPAYYHQPKTIQDMVDFVVGRICDQLGVENTLMERWGAN
jgi:4-hydroxy-3-polyprenylbenzoate decarboxylase